MGVSDGLLARLVVPAGLEVQPLGPTPLKGLAGPIELFAVVRRSSPVD